MDQRGRSRSRSRSRSAAPKAIRGRSSSRSRSRSASIGNMNRFLYRTGGRVPFSIHEKKDLTVINALSINSVGVHTANGTLINGCAQGTTASTRVGRQILMKSIAWRYFLTPSAAMNFAGVTRLMFVYDRQANATGPSALDILQADRIISPMNLSNSKRFKVILDKLHSWGVGESQVNESGFMKLNLPVEFNTGSAGTIGDIQSGSLYAFIWSAGDYNTADPLFELATRIRYVDS